MPKRSRKSSRQAEAGEVEETERATYKHDAEAVDEVAAELQDGVRCMVQCNLESATWRQPEWSRAGFPTLTDVAPLSGDDLFRV